MLVIYSRFDGEVLSRLSLVLCLGIVLFIDILNLSNHTWDFSLSMAYIYRAMSRVVSGPRPIWTTMSSGNPIYHERYLSGHVQSSLRATSHVNNHEFRQPHLHERHLSGPVQSSLRTTSDVNNQRDQGTPSVSYLYEFALHCHLLGNLSIRSSTFWQQWFQNSINSKH